MPHNKCWNLKSVKYWKRHTHNKLELHLEKLHIQQPDSIYRLLELGTFYSTFALLHNFANVSKSAIKQQLSSYVWTFNTHWLHLSLLENYNVQNNDQQQKLKNTYRWSMATTQAGQVWWYMKQIKHDNNTMHTFSSVFITTIWS